METKTCKLDGCGELLVGKAHWVNFCCKSHSAKYAAKVRNDRVGLPNKTKEEYMEYSKIYSGLKAKRIKIAKPSWANNEAIAAIYKEAREITKITGIKHEVDHIIPLTNELVCGLHIETNLQIIPMSENRSKYNKFICE